MKKLVFKKFLDNTITELFFEGIIDKGGCFVNKNPDAEVHVFQRGMWLGKFEGKRKIKICEKVFPMIDFDKSSKVYRDMSFIVRKIGWNTNIVKTLRGEQIKSDGVTDALTIATLDTLRVNMVVTLKFLNQPIDYESELLTFKNAYKITGYNLVTPKTFQVAGGLEHSLGVMTCNAIKSDPSVLFTNVQNLEKSSNDKRLYLCQLEKYVEEFDREHMGYSVEVKIIGLEDNVAAYM